MSVTLRIPFEQLKEMIEQLSPSEKEELKTQLDATGEQRKESMTNKLQELLRQGPVMDEAQLSEIKKNRDRINQWRS